MTNSRVIVVGSGIFGVTAALEMSKRGWDVTLLDSGTIPHFQASSTDISKVCRMEYGQDQDSMTLMEDAFEGWDAWNQNWRTQGKNPLYHQTGILITSSQTMSPGSFEYESYHGIQQRGWPLTRLNKETIASQYPLFAQAGYQDGFFNPKAGYAQSAAVVTALLEEAISTGVVVHQKRLVKKITQQGECVTGLLTESGQRFEADHVVLCTGVWTSQLLPDLARSFKISSHPVFHFQPSALTKSAFQPPGLPVFAADIARTGIYGFPLNDGIVKVASHGLGGHVSADAPRVVAVNESQTKILAITERIKTILPALGQAKLIGSHLCFYCDTQDENFWLANDPNRSGLTVASGGSGHGFKFAPILGPMIADTVEGQKAWWSEKFRWRPELRLDKGCEESRARDRA
jgi:sarcosine oxidase / L-pipecolate oxidase